LFILIQKKLNLCVNLEYEVVFCLRNINIFNYRMLGTDPTDVKKMIYLYCILKSKILNCRNTSDTKGLERIRYLYI